MNQSSHLHLLHIASISLRTGLSETATVFDENEEGEDLHQTCGRGDDEGVLEAHVGDPGGDATE